MIRCAGPLLAKAVPTFALTVPPGGKEGDQSISAHWFGVAGGRLDAGADVWVIGGFYFPPGMPVVRKWGVVWNFHTVGGDVGWPIGVSPVQIDITNGLLHVFTHGGGSIGTIGGIPQPVDVTSLDFPRSCQVTLLRGAWTDWVMHLKLDSKHGFVKLWQRGVLLVDARNVPTLYTGEQHVELWVGFYTNGEANPDQTFAMALEAPRIGDSFRAAVRSGTDRRCAMGVAPVRPEHRLPTPSAAAVCVHLPAHVHRQNDVCIPPLTRGSGAAR